MVPFSQLPAAEKDTIFVLGRNFFGPSYFVKTLKRLSVTPMIKNIQILVLQNNLGSLIVIPRLTTLFQIIKALKIVSLQIVVI